MDSRILFLPTDIGDIAGGFQDTIDTYRYRRYRWVVPG